MRFDRIEGAEGKMESVPKFDEMMCEMFQAVKELGGSGTIREIDERTIGILALSQENRSGIPACLDQDLSKEVWDFGEFFPRGMGLDGKGP